MQLRSLGSDVRLAGDHRGYALWLALADQCELHALADAQHADAVAQLAGALHVLAVDRGDDVARQDARRLGGGALDHLRDEHALHVVAEPEALAEVGSEAEDRDAERAAAHLAELDQLLHHVLDHVRGNGEANAHVAAGLRQDRGVDADQLAAQVDQRAARVARVDGRIGLDEVLVTLWVDAGAASGTDDPGGDGVLQPEGIADGDDEVADLEAGRVRQGDLGGQAALDDLDHGDIRALVGADDLGLELAVVDQRYRDFLGVVDHVGIGDDIAGTGVDYHARACAPELALARRGARRHAEEATEVRIFEERVAR